MFILTTKLTKSKLIAGILFVFVLLCALIFYGNFLQRNEIPLSQSVADNSARIAYLRQWGWETAPSAAETLDLVLPDAPEDVSSAYCDLQSSMGFDLSLYAGRPVRRYTYRVLNYPGRTDDVQANLYLCEDRVIGGDIIATGPDGFQSSLFFPR